MVMSFVEIEVKDIALVAERGFILLFVMIWFMLFDNWYVDFEKIDVDMKVENPSIKCTMKVAFKPLLELKNFLDVVGDVNVVMALIKVKIYTL